MILLKLNQKWIRSFFSFGSMHLMTLLIPLLAFPWLSRVLGPTNFGFLMFLCLFPPFFTLFVEWGFPLGGSRLAARHRDHSLILKRLLGQIITAKLTLAFCALLFSIFLLPVFPFAMERPLAFFLAALAGIAKAISPLWFYQGIGQKLPLYAGIDMTFSLLALFLVFLFIHQPSQWPLYFLFLAICRFISNIALTYIVWRQYKFNLNFLGAFLIIRKTAAIFGILFFSNAYHYCFQLVLGYFLAASEMGVIVALDKMLRALIGLINPFTQTIFPEICILHDKDPLSTWRLLRRSLVLTFLVASLISILMWVFAPLIIQIALGSAYQNANEILRIMLFSVPVAVCAQVLGSQVLVPFGKDKIQSLICALVSLGSIPFTALLAYYYGIIGGAFVPLCVESGLCIGFISVVIKIRGRTWFEFI